MGFTWCFGSPEKKEHDYICDVFFMQYDMHILYTLGFATENFKIWSARIRASACVDILRGRSVGCSTPDLWRSTYRAVCTTKYVPCFKMSEIFLFRLHFEGGHGNQTSGYSTDPLAEVLLWPLSFEFQPCAYNTQQNDHLKLLPRQSGSGGFSNMSYGCWFFNLQVASFRLIY